jgi:hypothetical protein
MIIGEKKLNRKGNRWVRGARRDASVWSETNGADNGGTLNESSEVDTVVWTTA